MQIQVNSDKSVAVDMELSKSVEANVNDVLGRFSDRITRVEVHFGDVNGDRSGNKDKRCLMEARVAGRDPVVVTDEGATPEIAAQGAARKMRRLLGSVFGRTSENVS